MSFMFSDLPAQIPSLRAYFRYPIELDFILYIDGPNEPFFLMDGSTDEPPEFLNLLRRRVPRPLVWTLAVI